MRRLSHRRQAGELLQQGRLGVTVVLIAAGGMAHITTIRLQNPALGVVGQVGLQLFFDPQDQALGLDTFGQDGREVAQQICEVNRRLFQDEFSGLDLRNIENVVDDRQQVPG